MKYKCRMAVLHRLHSLSRHWKLSVRFGVSLTLARPLGVPDQRKLNITASIKRAESFIEKHGHSPLAELYAVDDVTNGEVWH